MNIANDLFIRQQLTRLQSSCSQAEQLIFRARTIAEVIRHTQVSAPSYLKAVARRELQQVNVAAQRQAEILFKAELAELNSLHGAALAQRLRTLRVHEWCHLGGHFPRLAQDANHAGVRAHQRATSEIAAEQCKPAAPCEDVANDLEYPSQKDPS